MGLFTVTAGESAIVYFPGAPFIAAAAMSLLTLVLYAFAEKRLPSLGPAPEEERDQA